MEWSKGTSSTGNRKSLSCKNILPEILSPNQNANVKNRCISEGARLISDLLEMGEVSNKEDFLVILDIEKAFNSVNHNFIIAILEK